MSPEGNTSKHLKLRRVKSNAGHKMTPFYGQVLQNVKFKSILPSLQIRVESNSRAKTLVVYSQTSNGRHTQFFTSPHIEFD